MAAEKLKELTGFALEDLLPHREDMLLIDDVLEVDACSALTEAVVNKSYPMAGVKDVPPVIMVELAAQTAGVCNALTRIKKEGKDSSKMGWLVGVKRAQFSVNSIALGSRLLIRSENSHEFDMLREVSCVVHLDDVLIGEMTLQLIQA
jgi:predicted hotdog family 3-hydroxylacyl-ACP dehydratase